MNRSTLTRSLTSSRHPSHVVRIRSITLHERSSNPLRFQSSRAQPRKEPALFVEQGSVTASDMEMVAPHGNAWKLGLQTTA